MKFRSPSFRARRMGRMLLSVLVLLIPVLLLVPSLAQPVSTVIPLVHGVGKRAGRTFVVFGYINTGPIAVTRSYGSANGMSPGDDILPNQPFFFLPGRRDFVWIAEAPHAPMVDPTPAPGATATPTPVPWLTWTLSQVRGTADRTTAPIAGKVYRGVWSRSESYNPLDFVRWPADSNTFWVAAKALTAQNPLRACLHGFL